MSKKEPLEMIEQIELTKLHPFPDHPFGVRDDDSMQQTVESIREYGVLVPAIARPLEDGTYELISGHRRKHACELAGLETMPVIVRDLDRNAAIIIMVDSNLQRENILPSERAKAYKMKLEAIKRRAGRPSRNSVQVGQNFEGKTSREQIAENSPDSATQIQRYIRLTELEPQLMQMVDEGKIGMTPAVEISYLKPDEQKLLIETIDSEQAIPSLSQAQRMKRLSQEGKLNDDSMLGIMMEQKKPETWDLKLPINKIQKYFPRSYTPQRMEETIIKLLDKRIGDVAMNLISINKPSKSGAVIPSPHIDKPGIILSNNPISAIVKERSLSSAGSRFQLAIGVILKSIGYSAACICNSNGRATVIKVVSLKAAACFLTNQTQSVNILGICIVLSLNKKL